MMRRAAAGAILTAALSLWAASLSAQAERIQQAWTGWLSDHATTPAGIFVTGPDGEIAVSDDGIPPDRPVPLASLSKAVTALCVKALVDEGRLSWTAPLSEVIGQGRAITVAELATHRSGLMPDQTQGAMTGWRGGGPRWRQATETALGRPTQDGTRGSYAYNNENYAALGVVIEKVAAEDYATACKRRVTVPLGLTTADLDPAYGAFAPWGGWQMALRDYARLMQAHADTDPLVTPAADLGGGAYYGLGMLVRPTGTGAHRWHFGMLCFDDGAFGTYAVRWANGTTVVATWTGCIDTAAMAALDQTLARAVFSD